MENFQAEEVRLKKLNVLFILKPKHKTEKVY